MSRRAKVSVAIPPLGPGRALCEISGPRCVGVFRESGCRGANRIEPKRDLSNYRVVKGEMMSLASPLPDGAPGARTLHLTKIFNRPGPG